VATAVLHELFLVKASIIEHRRVRLHQVGNEIDCRKFEPISVIATRSAVWTEYNFLCGLSFADSFTNEVNNSQDLGDMAVVLDERGSFILSAAIDWMVYIACPARLMLTLPQSSKTHLSGLQMTARIVKSV